MPIVTAKHEPWCDKVFTSNYGEQHSAIGSLKCLCGQIVVYSVPDSRVVQIWAK